MLEFICPDEQTTADLAVKLASVAQTGDVFALYGTLGMGKSVLARAFIQSLTAVEDVAQPDLLPCRKLMMLRSLKFFTMTFTV